MKIGFDVSQTGHNKAGCGYFADSLARALLEIAPEHDYQFYPSFGDFYFDHAMPFFNPFKGGKYRPRHLRPSQAAAFWNHDGLEHALGMPDIIHANNFWCPVELHHTRLIYSFYDMGFVTYPEYTTELNRIGCFEGVFRSAIIADWVVAISEASRRHYLEHFPFFPADRIRVVYPCSRFHDNMLVGKRPKGLNHLAPDGFLLSVGTIEPRKNQHMLVQAYRDYAMQAGDAAMPLILAGGQGWMMRDFPNFIAEMGLKNKVILTGYVSDDELIWLYRHCYANFYPSNFEGFGLPVLEGMQFGAACIIADNSSLPEVGGDATILLPADDVELWTKNMIDITHNLDKRNRMKETSLQQAGRFNWKNSASELLALYQEALNAPKREVTG